MPVFQYRYRVAYADCAVGDHVYYSRYLEILEKARGEFFRYLGTTFLDWQKQDVIFPVVECRLRYLAPARYDDEILVELWLSQAERIRLNFVYRILDQSAAVIVEGETCHVCTDLHEKAKRLPDALKAAITPYLVTDLRETTSIGAPTNTSPGSTTRQ